MCEIHLSELVIACCRFTPAIASINSDLQQLAASRQDMHFVDCGQEFTYEGETGRIHAALMPDGVNLNAAGMEQLASCLDPIIHVSNLFFPTNCGCKRSVASVGW